MKLRYFAIYSLLMVLMTGCMHLNYPHREQYILNVKSPSKLQTQVPHKVLAINNVVIAPQFSSFSFVYRISDVKYTRDYYHIFFNPPAQQIKEVMVKYLRAEKLFKYVINNAMFLSPHYILHAKVMALYADYRDKQQPKAVMAIHFVLFVPNKKRILLDKTLQAAVPLQRKDTPNLVYAWNAGLTNILMQLSALLRQGFAG